MEHTRQMPDPVITDSKMLNREILININNNKLPAEMWCTVAEYLSLVDLKSIRLGCKAFRDATLLPFSKKTRIILKLSCGNHFSRQIEKFCRDVYPILNTSTSSVRILLNFHKFKAAGVPTADVLQMFEDIQDRLIYVRKRNECYRVKQVFQKFNDVELFIGIGNELHISSFLCMWKLVSPGNAHRLYIRLKFGNGMASKFDIKHIEDLDEMVSVQELTLFYVSEGFEFNAQEISKSVLLKFISKFPNVKKIEVNSTNNRNSIISALSGQSQTESETFWKAKSNLWGGLIFFKQD